MFECGRGRVRVMREAGEPVGQIAVELGITPATVSYHARNLGFPRKPRARYHWSAIQRYYDDGHTYAQTKARFAFSNGAWGKAGEAGKIVSRRNVTALDTWLVAGSGVNRQHLKHRLVE